MATAKLLTVLFLSGVAPLGCSSQSSAHPPAPGDCTPTATVKCGGAAPGGGTGGPGGGGIGDGGGGFDATTPDAGGVPFGDSSFGDTGQGMPDAGLTQPDF